MASSNIDRSWNHVEQMNDGGNSTHKTMRQRRKRIEMAPFKSGWTAIAGIELPPDTPDDQDEEKKLKGSESRDMVDVLKSGWTLLLISLIIEIASAVCDQLRYPLVGMVLAFVALLVATADLLIHMAPEERTSLLPIYLRPLTTHSHGTKGKKPGGTFVEYFGLVGAVWQCVYSTVAYAYSRQKKDNPIKMSLLPLIFLFFVVKEKISLTKVLRKELEKISEREKDRMKGGRPEKGSTMSGKESDDGCADGEIATERERGVFNHGVQQPKRMHRPRSFLSPS